jgi:hypothetical protein
MYLNTNIFYFMVKHVILFNNTHSEYKCSHLVGHNLLSIGIYPSNTTLNIICLWILSFHVSLSIS